ncbi:hypothetical protein RIF29_37070 [Crotalaria pallida]|uniref:Encoded peptide n=1 Tax=Crotalaria pallida TaxID=3830 RepID=A0AAN9EHA6_CROPI
MAQNNKSFFLLILLALIIFCLGFQSIEGRYLKSDQLGMQKQVIKDEHHEDMHDGVTTINATTFTNVMSPPTLLPSEADGATTGVPPPPGHGIDDFRPTAPGHSPGVGHSVHN